MDNLMGGISSESIFGFFDFIEKHQPKNEPTMNSFHMADLLEISVQLGVAANHKRNFCNSRVNHRMLCKGGSVKRILYVEGCRDGTVGGSHTCLYSMVANFDRRRFYPIVVFYYDHAIAEKLRRIGVETHILKYFKPLDFSSLSKKVSPSLKRIFMPVIIFQKLVNFLWYFLMPAILYARYLRKLRIDIIHLNNSLNSNHEWMLAAMISRIKIVSHERGINENLSKTSKVFGRSLDKLICMSEIIRTPLLKQSLIKTKTVIIYDGIDTSKVVINRSPEELKLTYGIGNDDPVIGVVGNIKQWKGQEIVVRATALLKKDWPGIKCLLVGGTIDGDLYKEKLENITRELLIEKNVIFAGFQENPADFMNIMDVVIHSSIAPEPFGMVNLEAMYIKKPVVSTNIGGPMEIFKNGEDGVLIEPNNPVELARKISMLLESPKLRMKLGQRANETVMRRFRINDTVSKIQKVYEEICPK